MSFSLLLPRIFYRCLLFLLLILLGVGCGESSQLPEPNELSELDTGRCPPSCFCHC